MKRILSLLICLALLLGAVPVSFAEKSNSTTKTATNPFAEVEEGELARATAWGLVPQEWQAQLEEDISYAEFCALVRHLVEELNPEQLAYWDETAALGHDSDQIMGRDDGAVGLLYAAQSLDCCARTSWNYPVLDLVTNHPETWNFDLEFPLWPELPEGYQMCDAIPGTPEESVSYGGAHNSTIDAAFWFVLLRKSPFNEMPLMSWDSEYNLRMGENLTRREAVVYLWRLAEGAANLLDDNNYISVRDVGTYDTSIITDELLSRPSDLPEVTHSQLPSDWNGIGLTAYKCRTVYREFSEAEFALFQENNINFTRVFLAFPALRFPDYPDGLDLVNEAEFRDIDQLIAWGIEYGVHIQLSMNTTPSGYMRLWDANDEEWEYIQAYWEAFARRYAGIPSRYLSFDLFNEMEMHRGEAAKGLEKLEKMVTSLREIDPGRVLLTSLHTNADPEWAEGAAKLGLSLGYHPYEPIHLCEGDNGDLRKPAQASWPYPYFPQVIHQGESLVIEGEIGGQVLWMDMWEDNSCRVSFDNGEKTDYVSQQGGGRSEKPVEIRIPDGVTRLEVTPAGNDLSFWQIGIQAGLDSENPQPSNENYLVPHDLWIGTSSGGAHLFWDAESGFSSERNCSPEYVYETLIKPRLELAHKYGVGLMCNEVGTYAGGCGWDVSIKKNYDTDIIGTLEEHGIPWCMNELTIIVYVHPQQEQGLGNKLWDNTEFVEKLYEFEDGRRVTIIYSPELMDVYKELAMVDANPDTIDPLLKNNASVPFSGSYYAALEKGDKSDAVKALQEALISGGYLNDKADGIFGKKTQAAVEKFQNANGFEATGVATNAVQQLLFNP